jgi:hypothetical protein
VNRKREECEQEEEEVKKKENATEKDEEKDDDGKARQEKRQKSSECQRRGEQSRESGESSSYSQYAFHKFSAHIRPWNSFVHVKTPAQYDVVPLLTFMHPSAKQVLPPPCFTQNCVGDWADL